MTSSIDLDTKALEAAAAALYDSSAGGTSDPILLDMLAATCLENAKIAVYAYLFALPKPSDEVAGMVKRLRAEAQRRLDWRTYCNQAPTAHDEEETFLLKTATLLEALDADERYRKRINKP